MAAMEIPPEKQMEMYVKQFSEFMAQYNRITDMCFTDCATDFTTRNILTSENSCAMNCVDKYLKATQRMSERFSEHSMLTGDTPASNIQGMKK